jgi:Ca2+-binding EF-hand superfamily protein
MLHPNLFQRFQRLFQFLDRNNDGFVEYKTDLLPVAEQLASRKFKEGTAEYLALFKLLSETYQWENSRRDRNHDGKVTMEEFVPGHEHIVEQMAANPDAGLDFIAKAAGGFFDVLDLDGDGYLSLMDVQAYAHAYGKEGEWVAENFNQLINHQAEQDPPPAGDVKSPVFRIGKTVLV